MVQVTEIYSAGRWMLEIKLGHIFQDSLSCHLYSLLHPHSPLTSVLSWLEDVDSGTVIQASKDSSLYTPWGRGFPDQDTCPGGQPEYVLDLDTAGIQCEMEDQWMIDGL